MTAALAQARDTELSPAMVDLLKAGAAHKFGYLLTLRSQASTYYRELAELERLGFQRRVGGDPMITDAGRKAIGQPTELELICKNTRALFAKPGAPVTRRQPDDPRSRMTYESYRSARMFCTLVVKLAEPPIGARGLKCSMNGDPLRWFTLPSHKIIIQPESQGSFILAVVPKWLAKPFDPKRITELAGVLPELCDSIEWTEDQKTDWNRLRRKASIINTRIRNGGVSRSSDRRNGAIFT